MSNITIAPDGSSAVFFGNVIKGQSPTEVYVRVITEILAMCPGIIGQKETHFTSDKARADRYTGTTRTVNICDVTVYIKNGFSTKDKIKGIEKTCQLAGIDFSVTYEQEDDFFDDLGDVDFGFDTDFSSETKENTEDDPFDDVDPFADVEPFDDDFFNISNEEGLDFSDVMQEDHTANEIVSADTTDSENFDPELNFAFHSEYYNRYGTGGLSSEKACSVLSQSYSYFNGNIYLLHFSHRSNTIFKILPDRTIKAIVSKDKYFQGSEFAVNRHGIFCKDNSKFYLFDEDGKLKSKLTLKQKQPAAIYIYDNYIYSVSTKGDLYCHNILNNKNEAELIWSFSDFKPKMSKSFEEYFFSVDPNKKFFKSSVSISAVNTLCCNEEYIIAGFNLRHNMSNEYTFYIAINKVTKECKILETSDNHAEFRVFSFDMSENVMWWYKENEDKSLSLFSTPIQSYEEMIKTNHTYSFKIPSEHADVCGKNSFSAYHGFYFDGTLACKIENMGTHYINSDGECKSDSDSYQTYECTVLNKKWMQRRNMGDGYFMHDITFVPYEFEKFGDWWTIKKEEFEAAYEKAISEK